MDADFKAKVAKAGRMIEVGHIYFGTGALTTRTWVVPFQRNKNGNLKVYLVGWREKARKPDKAKQQGGWDELNMYWLAEVDRTDVPKEVLARFNEVGAFDSAGDKGGTAVESRDRLMFEMRRILGEATYKRDYIGGGTYTIDAPAEVLAALKKALPKQFGRARVKGTTLYTGSEKAVRAAEKWLDAQGHSPPPRDPYDSM